jgi:hypothetical protein
MGYLVSIGRMIMDDELRGMCKEVVVACFKVLLHLPRWTEENKKKKTICQDNQSLN